MHPTLSMSIVGLVLAAPVVWGVATADAKGVPLVPGTAYPGGATVPGGGGFTFDAISPDGARLLVLAPIPVLAEWTVSRSIRRRRHRVAPGSAR